MNPYYEHAGITIYHGDCREVLPSLPPESVTLLWTDPPYGHGNQDGDLQSARVGVRGARQRAAVPIANDTELVMVAHRAKGRLAWADPTRAVSNILRMRPERNTHHPTTKPVAMAAAFIGWCTRPSDRVLDPFMGSGTALLAALELGRRGTGIEIEERYCEIAAKRLEQGEMDLGGAA